MSKVAVLIPSYNGAKTIGPIVKDITGRGLVVYVVDDGSTDETTSIAKNAGAIVIRHNINKGKGASLRDGFKEILKKDFDAVLLMDGDGQHDTKDIDKFLKSFSDLSADMIIGNRMSDTSIMPLSRKVTNRIMSYVISKLCGHKIDDTQCGFRLVNRAILEKANFKSSNYEIESEMLFKAVRKGFKIGSIPVKTVYRDEQSSINPVVDTLRFIVLLIRIMVGR